MRGRGRIRLWALIGLLIISLSVAAFYIAMNHAAREGAELTGAPPSARNSIQHAFAATQVYAWLRAVAVPASTAASLTRQLGYANEWAERFVKWPGDTAREVYKDLANNEIGILATAQVEACGTPLGRQVLLLRIGMLARDQVLLWRRTDARIPDLPDGLDVPAAIAAFERDRAAIVSKVAAVRECQQ